MIRFYNARILSMTGDDIFIGELWTNNDVISFIGTSDAAAEKLQAEPATFDREIDCEKNVLMPGFKNAHAHSGMTPLRSMADDMPLSDWLNLQIFPREAKLNGEMIYDATMLANLEYLTSGITANMDMYLTPETSAKACVDSGMRCVLNGNVNNFSSSTEYTEEMYQKMNHYHPLISYMLGFHAEYTCSPELIGRIADISAKYKAPVFTHISETASEVQGCVERYGMTPPAFLEKAGIFRYGGGGYHCVHFTEDDIAMFAEKGLFIVTNPGSNTKLASGIAPINSFLKNKIRVAIGTDGPASNNCLDMFREMFLVTGLAKLKESDAAVVDALDVLKMATVNGALAMGLKDCDVLAVGKQADLIMIDLHTPNMQPLNNIAKNIVYSGSKMNIKITMIAGEVLYENGRFDDRFDVERIYRKANEIVEAIR